MATVRPETRRAVVRALIEAAADNRRSWKHEPDALRYAILPKWQFDMLTEADLEELRAANVHARTSADGGI